MSTLPLAERLPSDSAWDAARKAADRIAPSWPLDRFIAVNPFWSLIDRPLSEVGEELTALSGARLCMPRAWYAARHARGTSA